MVVYEYGLLQPTSGVDVVDDQILLAHRYYNNLIEIERDRRQAIIEAQASVGSIAEEQTKSDEADALVKDLSDRKKKSRGRGSKVVAPSKIDIAEAKVNRAAARKLLREAKVVAKEELAPLYAAVDEAAHVRRLAARKACGVYWGTYLVVEQAYDQARKSSATPGRDWGKCPSFRRWSGAGAVAVQIQGGLPCADVFGDDTRIRVDPLPPNAYDSSVPRGQRNRLQRTVLHLRVGSDENRAPVWAEWPLYMHRPLPDGAVIKWAKIIRVPWHQRWRYRWKLQLTLDVPEVVTRPGNTMVAVNLGWRLMDDSKAIVGAYAHDMDGGELRVATWADSRGDTGEVRLGRSFRDRIEKAEKIRSVRDLKMDVLREFLVKAGVDCAKWRSPRRFHRLLAEIEKPSHGLDACNQGHRGGLCPRRGTSEVVPQKPSCVLDAEARDTLRRWTYRDKHLWWYERGCRSGALNYRREIYRLFALDLAKKYSIIVVEDYDLRDIVTDENRVLEPSAQRVEGAPSVARFTIRSTATRVGCTVVDGDSKRATQRCHLCGCEEPWDAAPRVMHTCLGCGESWDQDVNNARNMLASASDAMKAGDLLAKKKVKRPARFAKTHRNGDVAIGDQVGVEQGARK